MTRQRDKKNKTPLKFCQQSFFGVSKSPPVHIQRNKQNIHKISKTGETSKEAHGLVITEVTKNFI